MNIFIDSLIFVAFLGCFAYRVKKVYHPKFVEACHFM
jgi:hypothetical protein